MTALRNHGGRLTLPPAKAGDKSIVIDPGAYLQPVPDAVAKHPLVIKQISARTTTGVGGIEAIG